MEISRSSNIKVSRPKVAIVHPKLGWGGSEAIALWVILALKDDYDVSLITSGRVDISGLNKYYGLNLDPKEFLIIQVPMPLGLKNTAKFSALRGRLIQRYCQRVASQFDLMISAYNPCDFKVKGIQFAVDIEELPAILPLQNWKRWWYGDTFLRRIYLKFCDWISPDNPEAWKNNLTLAISNWTAELMRQKYGIKAHTLYPPVANEFPTLPYKERENGFICIGRIVPEKRIETAIKILEKIRQRGHDIHLHIIGGIVDTKYYTGFLKEFCLKNKKWLFFEGRLSGQKKKELITKHCFGIVTRKNEPFGIAVAEMVKAGCIVFVPSGGGQTEIVDHPNLIYEGIEDAVRKIKMVLESKEMEDGLREHLSLISQRFSVENFKKAIRDVVSEFFHQR
ncbi:MAG: glycosyltransferase family 4 protein [Nitrospirota bacterium]